MIARWLTRFLQPRCIGCGRAAVVGLCDDCAARLPHLGIHCPTCANGVADARFACGTCLRRPPAYSRLLVRWQFRDVVRSTILSGKFYADRCALRVLEDETCRLLNAHPVQVDAVLAMPIANRRLHQRGFNQTLFPPVRQRACSACRLLPKASSIKKGAHRSHCCPPTRRGGAIFVAHLPCAIPYPRASCLWMTS